MIYKDQTCFQDCAQRLNLCSLMSYCIRVSVLGYGHDLQRPNVFPGLCTMAELVLFNSCLCVIMQLDLSSVTNFVQYVCVLCILVCTLSVWPCLYTSTY